MKIRTHAITLAVLTFLSIHGIAQTSAFNFQGRLNDGSSPANGHYDLQFKLYDAITGGNQIGPMIDRQNTVLINGVFSTTLDFGVASFNSGARFLEIAVRPTGSPNAHVVLGARQQILSVPFAVRAANATNADHATNADTAQLASNSNALGTIPAANFARLDFLNPGGFRVTGDMGVGTDTPNTRLTLSGGPTWTSGSWTASMNMQNGAALGWEPNASGQRFGLGQTTGGLSFFRTFAAPGQTIPPANTDLRITDNGNIAQPIDRNGMVKAIVAITANGTIARCYNGVSGDATTNCGITVVLNNQDGVYFVDFPFAVSNRYWIVSNDNPAGVGLDDSLSGRATLDSAQRLRVWTYLNGSRAYLPFHLFVF